MTWWLKLILIFIAAPFIVLIIYNSEWTINIKKQIRIMLSVFSIIILAIVGYFAVKAQWLKDHPPSSHVSGQVEYAIPIYEPFKATYIKYQTKLGKATYNAVIEQKENGFSYQASHEHAMVIWFMNDMYFYFLNDDSTWKRYHDRWDSDRSLKNDDKLKNMFHLPNNCDPPYAGVARLWKSYLKELNWIGCRKWHCQYNQGVYQYFEHGIIMGNFRRIEIDSIHKPLLYVLITEGSGWNKGHWEMEQSEASPPDCATPLQLK